MSLGGFGALGEFALGETGDLNDTQVKPGVIGSTSELLQANTYAGQSRNRSSTGAWGEGALGEFALGEGEQTLPPGAEVYPGVVESAGQILHPSVRAGASVSASPIETDSELPNPLVSAGVSLQPDVIESVGEVLDPTLRISASVIITNVIGSASATLTPDVHAGSSVQPAQHSTERNGAWGEGALGEYAHGEGPPQPGRAHPIESIGHPLAPKVVAGKSIIIDVLETTSEALDPLVSAGASLQPAVLETTSEILDPVIRISVSIFPGVVESTGHKLHPQLSAGKSVLPGAIGSSSYLLHPETAARRRRIWLQAIAS